MASSITRKLEEQGYLSLSQFVKYLKAEHPAAYVSYPTALKLANNGNILAVKMGSQFRISRREVERWVASGNAERGGLPSPYLKEWV